MRLTLSALVDGGATAVLLTPDLCEIRVPRSLLPLGARIGCTLKLQLALDETSQKEAEESVRLRGVEWDGLATSAWKPPAQLPPLTLSPSDSSHSLLSCSRPSLKTACRRRVRPSADFTRPPPLFPTSSP